MKHDILGKLQSADVKLESIRLIIRASRRDALVKHYSDVHQTTPRALEGGVEGGNANSDVVVDGIFDL